MADAAARLRALPTATTPDVPPLICRRPACPNPVVANPRGRRAEFCSTTCRRLLDREREQIRARIASLRVLADRYGVHDAFDAAHDASGPSPSHPPPPVDAARAALAHLALALDLAEVVVEQAQQAGGLVAAETVIGRLRLAKRQADRMLLDAER